MYTAVPTIRPTGSGDSSAVGAFIVGRLLRRASRALARPKSSTLTCRRRHLDVAGLGRDGRCPRVRRFERLGDLPGDGGAHRQQSAPARWIRPASGLQPAPCSRAGMRSLISRSVNRGNVRVVQPGERSASRSEGANRSASAANASGGTLVAASRLRLVWVGDRPGHAAGADFAVNFDMDRPPVPRSLKPTSLTHSSYTGSPRSGERYRHDERRRIYRSHIMSSNRLRPSGSCSHQSVFAAQ